MKSRLMKGMFLLITILIVTSQTRVFADYPPINRSYDSKELLPPTLEPDNVVNIAKSYAIENGFDIKDQKPDEVKYEYTRKNWLVEFNSTKSDLYYDTYDITVYVEDVQNPRTVLEKMKSYNNSLKGDAVNCPP